MLIFYPYFLIFNVYFYLDILISLHNYYPYILMVILVFTYIFSNNCIIITIII